VYATDGKLAGIEPELSDDSYRTGNNGGGRTAANNSSSDIAFGRQALVAHGHQLPFPVPYL